MHLATPSTITVELFDVLGRKEATLTNGLPCDIGIHVLAYKTNGMARGMHIARFVLDNTVLTRKVIVAR
jgi:hypothetical protein